jgi:hypoxanthine phosphoribosyltransferase
VTTERERLSWTEFGDASRELARQVVADRYSPDLVLSVARGGLLVGAALGYALDVKNAWAMNVEFYTGVDERLDVPMILPPVPELVDLDSARMLIADDVADTGETLRLVKDFCAGKVGEVRCAVLYEKPSSVIACEYVWRGRSSGSTSRGACMLRSRSQHPRSRVLRVELPADRVRRGVLERSIAP